MAESTRKTNARKSTVDRAPEAAPDAPDGSCNLPGCPLDAVTRGLCDAHWSTHRGLADADTEGADAPPAPSEARP